MKILYVITRADLGGAQVHLLDLLEGFKGLYEVEVAVGEEGFLTAEVRRMGLKCHVISSLVHPIRPLQDARAVLALQRLVHAVQPDLIHVHTSKAGLIGRLAGWLAGCPVVFTAHTWCFSEGTSWKWRLIGIPGERIAARLGSLTINVSEANHRLAISKRIGPMNRMVTIHNGISDVPWRAKPDSDVPLIAMVARFAPQKDHALLLKAISRISMPVRVVFIGDGVTRGEMESEVKRLNQQDYVQFLGNRSDIPELLASADIFALPTRWEGFPLSILEAMRAGLPVIASDVGGVSEALDHGETGFLCPSGDLPIFQAHLAELIRDTSLRLRMGNAGRNRFEANFQISSMLSKLDRRYHEVLRRRSRDPLTVKTESGLKASQQKL